MFNLTQINWAELGMAKEPRLIKTFDDGHNHDAALIESDGELLVIKLFRHSFERTINAERWASNLDVAPKLHTAINNMALYQYIDNQGYTPSRLSDLAQTLTLVHQSETVCTNGLGNFDFFEFCHAYLIGANSSTLSWHAALLPVLTEFTQDPTPLAFCHNDLVTENCVFKNEVALFIDWEFAQTNNPWFDLAAITHYFQLSDAQAREFLAAYKPGWQHKVDERIFLTSQIAVLWCDLLWSMQTLGTAYKAQHPHRFKRLTTLAAKINIELMA